MTRSAAGSADDVWLADGALVLRTRRHASGYTTGAVSTLGKKSFGPGRVCVSARLPGNRSAGLDANQGLWPAHWLMPTAACDSNHSAGCWPDRGEYDIMEMINNDGVWHGTCIWNAFFPRDVCGVKYHVQGVWRARRVARGRGR